MIIDNLSAHKAERIRAAIEAGGCELVFLPTCSPDLNPIELALAKVKAILRQVGARTREALLDGIALAIVAMRANDALGWFAYAGYRPLPKSLRKPLYPGEAAPHTIHAAKTC